jgi:hypothetical protein
MVPPVNPGGLSSAGLGLGSGVGVAGILNREAAKAASSGQTLQEAFHDLSALMRLAQDMVALAERFRGVLGPGEVGVGAEGGDLLDPETQLQLIAMGIPSPVTKEATGAR